MIARLMVMRSLEIRHGEVGKETGEGMASMTRKYPKTKDTSLDWKQADVSG